MPHRSRRHLQARSSQPEEIGAPPVESVHRAKRLAEELVLIRDRTSLPHTCYVELCPGSRMARPCWNEGAVFVSLDVFALLDPLLRKAKPEISEIGFHVLDRGAAYRFAEGVRTLLRDLQVAEDPDGLGPYAYELPPHIQDAFDGGFCALHQPFLSFLEDLTATLESYRQESETLHVLGL